MQRYRLVRKRQEMESSDGGTWVRHKDAERAVEEARAQGEREALARLHDEGEVLQLSLRFTYRELQQHRGDFSQVLLERVRIALEEVGRDV